MDLIRTKQDAENAEKTKTEGNEAKWKNKFPSLLANGSVVGPN